MKGLASFKLLLLSCILSCQVSKPVQIAFTRASFSFGKDSASQNIRVFMTTDTTQKRSARGLRFSLKLQNDSSAPVVLVNPLDLFGVTMFDTAWKEVQFPYRGRTHGHDSGWKNRSFVVERLEINGKEADTTLLKDYYMTVPGNGQVEFFMGITHVLKPGAVRPFTLEQTMPVPAGKYKVVLTSGLMAVESGVVFHMQPVRIYYQ